MSGNTYIIVAYTVDFSFDSKILASGGGDNKIILWDPKKGERLKTLEGHSGSVLTVAWRYDGRLLASGGADNKIILWDPKKGERLKTLEGHSPNNEECTCKHDAGEDEDEYEADLNCPVQGHCPGHNYKGTVLCLVWAPDGSKLVSGGDNKIKLWSPSTGECLNTLEGHSDSVYSVGFSPTNPSQLVSGSGDKTIRLWDVDSGKELKKLEGQRYPHFAKSCEFTGVNSQLSGEGTHVYWSSTPLPRSPAQRGRGVDDQLRGFGPKGHHHEEDSDGSSTGMTDSLSSVRNGDSFVHCCLVGARVFCACCTAYWPCSSHFRVDINAYVICIS